MRAGRNVYDCVDARTVLVQLIRIDNELEVSALRHYAVPFIFGHVPEWPNFPLSDREWRHFYLPLKRRLRIN